jgi:hypothetical protein
MKHLLLICLPHLTISIQTSLSPHSLLISLCHVFSSLPLVPSSLLELSHGYPLLVCTTGPLPHVCCPQGWSLQSTHTTFLTDTYLCFPSTPACHFTQVPAYSGICTRLHMHEHTGTHVHIYTYVRHTCMIMCTQLHVHTSKYLHKHLHTWVPSHQCTCIHTSAHTQTHNHMCTHKHTCASGRPSQGCIEQILFPKP